MVSTMSDNRIRQIHESELRRAAQDMTPRERALADALLDLVRLVDDARSFLGILQDESMDGFDLAHAMLADEVSRQIRQACEQAVGAHASVVADILGPSMH